MKTYLDNDCVQRGQSQEEILGLINEQVRKLEKLVANKRESMELNIHVKPDGARQCQARLMLQDGKQKIMVKGQGENGLDALSDSFKAMRASVKKMLRKERKQFTRDKQQRQYEAYAQIAQNLVEARQQSDHERFSGMLHQAFPALKAYLKRRIRQAEKYRSLRLRAGSAEDLSDELYLRLYDSYRLHIAGKEEFLTWLYREADRLLNEKLNESVNEEAGDDIEALRKKERRSMEEAFVMDADGEFMMSEELDDPTYAFYMKKYLEQPHDFHFIIDEEDKLLDSIEEDSEGKELDERVNRILSALPILKQEIYELYYLEDLNTAQIALVKEITEEEVKDLITEVREYIETEMLKG